MGSDFDRQLHVFLFPFMAHGHMIPIVDMAKLFSSRGVKITIVTTPLNSISISKSLHKTIISDSPDSDNKSNIDILVIKFPSSEAGLPDGCENADQISGPDMMPKFFKATILLQPHLEKALLQHRPNCLVADMFFPWTNDLSAKLGIPRLIFHGTSFFSLCASAFMRLHEPYNHVSSDTEPFTIPYLPGEVKLTKLQLPVFMRDNVQNEFSDLLNSVKDSESKCYGVLVNSFYELESDYADCYRNVLGRKAWHIGPLFLTGKEKGEGQRGKESAIDEHECLKWLDSKKPNSVVYICFGSLAKFNSSQLKEIANGIEASGQEFIWVVRKGKGENGNQVEEEDEEDWLPKGFEERNEDKGLIIRGWAPQVLILSHGAIGGFVTHCGWNSTLEGIAAGGVPMVTWPIGAEQFYNEKLVTEVLKSGVGVGVKKWVRTVGDFVESEAVGKAIRRIMVGEEAEALRNRATEFAEMAGKAVGEDGSSYSNLNDFIEELKSLAPY